MATTDSGKLVFVALNRSKNVFKKEQLLTKVKSNIGLTIEY